MYLSPAASIAAFIAASSVFQRSSWKFDQDTPITLSFASATAASENDIATPARMAVANFFMISSLRRIGCDDTGFSGANRYRGSIFSSLEKIVT